ncbi:hypothetical protein POVCU2_0049540 [Plasmodium ovale curtisi]|uniref:Uncharacterized protein n=1 Tax=Plasmodium ovale curtisi TaxID=864141 RepID=A0A1A8X2K9_PLAOA|nr:hypothetical protein POVCU2_0049540 [Plasmodium ovale curtisi]SBS98407.1 hypothetical protein POVCU1_045920 [Plasmodium ovale curtisi]
MAYIADKKIKLEIMQNDVDKQNKIIKTKEKIAKGKRGLSNDTIEMNQKGGKKKYATKRKEGKRKGGEGEDKKEKRTVESKYVNSI